MSKIKMKRTNPNIRKKTEFAAFIRTLKDGTVSHWVNVAVALGVNKDTITVWKDLPEAQDAIKMGINKALEGMERTGGKDWRMWEAKLKMLGAIPTDKQIVDLTTKDEPMGIPILGNIDVSYKG